MNNNYFPKIYSYYPWDYALERLEHLGLALNLVCGSDQGIGKREYLSDDFVPTPAVLMSVTTDLGGLNISHLYFQL